MARQIRLGHDDYTVAWICAIPLELAAATAMFDEMHQDLPVQLNDHNSYALGRIFEHNVVIACLPSGKYGTVSASSVVVQLLSSFRSVRFGLMVGIGGGVPTSYADIRLGDIVVSKPTDTHGGVIEYDYGKVLNGGNLKRTGMLNRPPQVLLTAVSKLQAHHIKDGCQFMEFYAELENKSTDRLSNLARPLNEDRLYLSGYAHKDTVSETCASCDSSQTVSRPSRKYNHPIVHYGLIASANQVVKDSGLRDQLGRGLGAYCVEMEAAGVMDNLPCLVIRGICDYADSHKNDDWQGYASGVAAAYAKQLLLFTTVAQTNQSQKFHVPFDLTAVSAVENFMGREKESEQLWDYLRPSRQSSRKVAILHALGGMGKTQLATHFARAHRNNYTAVLWLNGKSPETLYQSLSSALSRLPDESQTFTARNEEEVKRDAEQVLRWLASPDNSNWLLIFDNVDQYSPGTEDGYDVGKFFPAADHGSILITSRLLKLSALGKSFPLQKLESKHATRLLLQSSGLSDLEIEQKMSETDRDLLKLVEHLDGLPLATTLAGSFIRETGTSFSKYLQYYSESWINLQKQSTPSGDYEGGNILQTWLVSYHELQKRDPEAAEVLLLIAHYDNQDVWYELLRMGGWTSNLPEWFERVMYNELTFREKMRTLVVFSFVGTRVKTDSYTMHPVVREWCLFIADSQKQTDTDRLHELALVSVGHMIPSNQDPSCWILQQRLLPHAGYILSRLKAVLLSGDIKVWNSIHCFGYLYASQCRLEEAERLYDWALTLCKKDLGPDYKANTHTLNLCYSMGVLYHLQLKHKEAREILKETLDSYMAISSWDPKVPGIMLELGRVYDSSFDLRNAVPMFQWAMSVYSAMYGPDHVLTLDCLDYIARAHVYCSVEYAEPICRTALETKIRVLGPDHMMTLRSYEHMAHVLRAQHKWGESEEMFQKALAMEKILGPDHPTILNQKRNLASVLGEQKNKAEAAEAMHKLTLAGYERKLGPDHFEVLDQLDRYAEFLSMQERWKDAEMVYRRLRMGYEKMFGHKHSYVRNASRYLESVLRAQEEPLKATKEPLEAMEELPKPRKRGVLSKLFRCR
ncbi:uncharacterized protein BDV14DRAFT_119957 [Aspergillus stella-maris]|uniref:uncharacterized protein n=1 Tax=Aspergillus stella-maris TaxID=1810926 RepID=UPI003CCD3959